MATETCFKTRFPLSIKLEIIRVSEKKKARQDRYSG